MFSRGITVSRPRFLFSYEQFRNRLLWLLEIGNLPLLAGVSGDEMVAEGARSLEDRLARDLPQGCHFIIHHLSAPPVKTSPIFAPVPGQRGEETFEELHFLSVSIEYKTQPLQVFAIEVYIYTTERLTTLFISKADSTGYLYLLDLPKGTPSPFRIICTTFLGFLVEERSRPDRTLVISLFARSQSQYLFPGSVENKRKHVLDDRALIKWWCKVVDPLLEEKQLQSADTQGSSNIMCCGSGYLRVPGCDTYEIRGFFPRVVNGLDSKNHFWKIGDPLQELAQSPTLPERCLIPRFPDDPKARFLVELDDDLPEFETDSQPPIGADGQPLPPLPSTGRWRSVKSLNEFWEAMSFRQECAAGRLVGFIWAVFVPKDLQRANDGNQTANQEVSLEKAPTSDGIPEQTKHYFWPPSSRGEVVLRPEKYKRVGKLLLKLDYGTVEDTIESTEALTGSVALKAGLQSWGRRVEGQKKPTMAQWAPAAVPPAPMMLSTSLIKKKKRPLNDMANDSTTSAPICEALQEEVVSKKAKTNEGTRDGSKGET